MTLSAYLDGLGILGPGLCTWPQAEQILCGAEPYTAGPTVVPTPSILPAAERRRMGKVVKLALTVALEATSRAGADPAQLASVFASSGGDGPNCHELCLALSRPEREISPTRFANSVHNAASGYWGIGTGAMAASNVLCAFDASFSAGLLEAMVQVQTDGEPVLLVSYDTEYPQPLFDKRPIPDSLGVAMVLSPQRSEKSLARLAAELTGAPAERMTETPLESLRTSIPAARALPLLQRLARRRAGSTILDYLDECRLQVDVDPCA